MNDEQTTVALLIPSTTKRPATSTLAPVKKLEACDLWKKTLTSLQSTMCDDVNYSIYVGHDEDEWLNKDNAVFFEEAFPEFTFRWIKYKPHVKPGHLTLMWNILAMAAFKQGHKYFFQCGDDIDFQTTNWTKPCIEAIDSMNGFGIAGQMNHHVGAPDIQTQTFFGRKHLDIFGFLFPQQIKNWYCDQWLTEVYWRLGLWRRLYDHVAINTSGAQIRYTPETTAAKEMCDAFIVRDLIKIQTNVMIQAFSHD